MYNACSSGIWALTSSLIPRVPMLFPSILYYNDDSTDNQSLQFEPVAVCKDFDIFIVNFAAALIYMIKILRNRNLIYFHYLAFMTLDQFYGLSST